MNTSTRFLAIFACYENSKEPGNSATPFRAFSPLLNEGNYSAAEHVAFIDYNRRKHNGKNTSNLAFLVGDNVNLNEAVVRTLDIPIIACYSHRLHLAVNRFLEIHETVLDKVNRLMLKLGGLKYAAELNKKTDLRPVKRQTTRWSSTSAMIQRNEQLKESLDLTNARVATHMPGPAEDLALTDLFTQLKKFESVSMKLQENSIDLATAKILFYGLKMDFEGFEHYLGDDGMCANPAFESAFVAAIEEKPLTPDEKLLLQPFASRQVVQEIGPEAAVSYAEQLLKKRKLK